MDPTMRTTAEASVDVINLATDQTKEQGYYTLFRKDTSSPDSLDESKQQQLWKKTFDWVKISKEDTALKSAFDE
jgi:hypothetical protein